MPYRRMLLDSKNSDRIFEESSLENLKMEDVFIVVSKVFSLHEDPQDLLLQQGALWRTPGCSVGPQFF